MDNIRLRIFDAGDRDDSALPRLLEWLPKSDMRESGNAYRVYDWLPRDRHMIGKSNAVNRNKALRSNLLRNLNYLPMRTRRCAKSADTLIRSLAIAFNARGWAVVNLSATLARQA